MCSPITTIIETKCFKGRNKVFLIGKQNVSNFEISEKHYSDEPKE